MMKRTKFEDFYVALIVIFATLTLNFFMSRDILRAFFSVEVKLRR